MLLFNHLFHILPNIVYSTWVHIIRDVIRTRNRYQNDGGAWLLACFVTYQLLQHPQRGYEWVI